MSEDPQPTARTQVERQAIDSLDNTESVLESVSKLDFDHWQRDDEYPQ